MTLAATLFLSGHEEIHAQQSPTVQVQVITLDEAIRRAQAAEPTYLAAAGDARIALLDRSIARAALLPSASAHTQALYTQPNGKTNSAGQIGNQPSPKFIANNAIHEYATQVLVNETIGFAQLADAKRAAALAAQASAQQEIARRGLVATVVELYFSAIASAQKLQLAMRAADEADNFSDLTGKLEAGREVAHADVIKAEIQSQQRRRDLEDAKLADEKARLDLAVLLFADPMTPYSVDQGPEVPPVPAMDAVEAAARRNNPDLGNALAAVQAADQEVSASQAAYLPDLALNFTYGIDAPQYALNGPAGTRNLGYAAFATIDFPVWDWFTTHNRVRQSEIRRDHARVGLTYAQKRLVAELHEFYNEAATANAALASLQNSVTAAAESLRLTRLKYSAGEATVLEVVDAQNTRIAMETELADGAARYRIALANLQTLTGTL
jgi:outer membrane protein TolC